MSEEWSEEGRVREGWSEGWMEAGVRDGSEGGRDE